ncbi:rrna-processing protein ebp2 [Cystoisospora suis]|uniref:Rrna-processing protein ebp2 n=1 Tax=Cystoisospora suis TaxID=483139 RepID=A0A2C6KPP3_9APIC|nr:rrna-processing protein ebp2 [Cystoisospora suis]
MVTLSTSSSSSSLSQQRRKGVLLSGRHFEELPSYLTEQDQEELERDEQALLLYQFRKKLQDLQRDEREEENEEEEGDNSQEANALALGYTPLPNERILGSSKQTRKTPYNPCSTSPNDEEECLEKETSAGGAPTSPSSSFPSLSKRRNGMRIIDDQAGLLEKLREIRYKPPSGMRRVPWIESLAVVCPSSSSSLQEEKERHAQDQHTPEKKTKNAEDDLDGDKEEEEMERKDQKGKSLSSSSQTPRKPSGPGQDLEREKYFMHMTRECAMIGLHRLRHLRLKFTRPPDFLAEMLKSDHHMLRIKERLASETANLELFEEKKLRKLNRKFNRLSGHRLVREQEEARRRNVTLKEIDAWKKSREVNLQKKKKKNADEEAEEERGENKKMMHAAGKASSSSLQRDDQVMDGRSGGEEGKRRRGRKRPREDEEREGKRSYIDAETSFDEWIKKHDEKEEKEKRDQKFLFRQKMKGRGTIEKEEGGEHKRRRRRREGGGGWGGKEGGGKTNTFFKKSAGKGRRKVK